MTVPQKKEIYEATRIVINQNNTVGTHVSTVSGQSPHGRTQLRGTGPCPLSRTGSSPPKYADTFKRTRRRALGFGFVEPRFKVRVGVRQV